MRSSESQPLSDCEQFESHVNEVVRAGCRERFCQKDLSWSQYEQTPIYTSVVEFMTNSSVAVNALPGELPKQQDELQRLEQSKVQTQIDIEKNQTLLESESDRFIRVKDAADTVADFLDFYDTNKADIAALRSKFIQTVESHTDSALWSKTDLALVKLSLETKRQFTSEDPPSKLLSALTQFDLKWPDVREIVEFLIQLEIMSNFTIDSSAYKLWSEIDLSEATV